MAQTVNQIIQAALRLLLVKDPNNATLTTAEAADGLQALNELIEEMNLQSLFQTAKTQITQVITPNDGTYTFGTGGDNSVRPLEIYSAYVVDSNVTYPVNVISNQEYSEIAFKTITSSYPCNIYFRAAYPLATVQMYPVPTVAATLYLETRAALATYTAGTDSVNLAPGYMKYLKNQLAIDISPEYKTPEPVVFENARKAKELIKRLNSIDKPTMCNTAQIAVRRGYGGA